MDDSSTIDVGRRLRELRAGRRISLRSLAEMSGLNVNTISLIENGKTSPSISTLQQVASALDVPITYFFQVDTPKQSVVHQLPDTRRTATFTHGLLADLGSGLARPGLESFLVTLHPHADSGTTPLVHTGLEFVYSLEGLLIYEIADQDYPCQPGASLLFEAHLPHRWRNANASPARFILAICPFDSRDQPTELHFNHGRTYS